MYHDIEHSNGELWYGDSNSRLVDAVTASAPWKRARQLFRKTQLYHFRPKYLEHGVSEERGSRTRTKTKLV